MTRPPEIGNGAGSSPTAAPSQKTEQLGSPLKNLNSTSLTDKQASRLSRPNGNGAKEIVGPARELTSKISRPIGMSRMESADDYSGLVVHLNPNWRIVECRDRIQWILQRRGSPEKARRDDWRGRSYCRTSEALRRCAREHAGVIDPSAVAVLAALPERIGAPGIADLLGSLAGLGASEEAGR
jgi:hypothetical protein